jgi:clan AA aspartic protease
MGRVMTQLTLTNLVDWKNARAGRLPRSKVRTTRIDGLVDTGATMLVLPAGVCRKLGLGFERERRKVRYADGRVAFVPWVSGVRIEILGREMTCDALVEGARTTALIGQIPLEGLDLVVDPKSRDVRVNPASPDAPLLDLLAAS